jgi:sugar phosphate permease
MMVSFIIAFLDRTNIGFAIPTMGKELNFSPAVLGFASGILFLGYGVSQTLGGWVADKGWGKPLIAVLMISWGIAEILQAYIHTDRQLIIVRFAVGFFEGGIFPTFLLFVKNWFLPSERARANGIWQLCYPVAAVVNGPIAGYIIKNGGWRNLFIIEGFFPILWVAVWLWGAADSPRNAKWISESEREEFYRRVENEGSLNKIPSAVKGAFWDQMKRKSVCIFTMAIFFWNIGFLGFIIWLPSVIRQRGTQNPTAIGWLSTIPFLVAIAAMQLLTYRADKTLNRRFYAAVPLAVSGFALVVGGVSFTSAPFAWNMLLLVISGGMLYGSQPVLWSIPTDILPSNVAGVVMGTINGIGVLGAFCGPYVVGYVRGITNSFASGLLVMGVCLIIAALCVWSIREASGEKLTVRQQVQAGAQQES